MNNQLKYKVTYGHSVEAKTVEVYAFNLFEALEIANKVTSGDVGRKAMTRAEQISGVKEFTNN